MKKAVAFLLALIIFVAPMTTLVKADVVIGDNDNTIINENAIILGRKLALMESFSDLALSGVTEFTISNSNDVDTYLDSLWIELNDAIESLSNGTGFTEISNELKSKYFTNLVQFKDYITNRGTYLAQLLPTGSPATTLLSTFFANNIFGKQTTQHYDLALDMFRALSNFSRNNLPQPDVDYISYINLINGNLGYGNDFFWQDKASIPDSRGRSTLYNFKNYSYCIRYQDIGSNISNGSYKTNYLFSLEPVTVNIFSNNDLYSFSVNVNNTGCGTYYDGRTLYGYKLQYSNGNLPLDTLYFDVGSMTNYGSQTISQSNVTLQDVFIYLSKTFRNINIYVDGVAWSLPFDNSNNNPILDIDGYLKIYGNDNPQQYELHPQTKIDYDQLYQVIYNAIRDNLPISQGDINYYDSHDTIYSPTIINNYGEEEGDESDLIDTILDYAVIPKFDTAIAQPMRQALTNGVVIMNNSITNVIPNEILLILGACFFLLLFAVVINRMIK